MLYIRKFKGKNKNGNVKTYYAEVEGIRKGNKDQSDVYTQPWYISQ